MQHLINAVHDRSFFFFFFFSRPSLQSHVALWCAGGDRCSSSGARARESSLWWTQFDAEVTKGGRKVACLLTCLFLYREEGIRGIQLKWVLCAGGVFCGISYTCWLFPLADVLSSLTSAKDTKESSIVDCKSALDFVMETERLEVMSANKTVTCRHARCGGEVTSIFGFLSTQYFNGEIYYCIRPALSSLPLLQLQD